MTRIFVKLTIIAVMLTGSLAAFNYVTDPYGIFHNGSLNLAFDSGYEPNQHFAKMRILLSGSHEMDSYLFGSSRVGKINPALLPDGKYYSMNYSEGVPGEHLQDIKIMLRDGLPIKNVIIGIDNMSYLIKPSDHRGQILRHQYDASLFRRVLFQVKYLCFAPRIGIGMYLRFKRNEPLITFGILENGMQNLEKVDKRIESDIQGHLNNERFSKANNVPFDEESEERFMKSMDDMLRDIAELVELSEKHNFNLSFFINPTHIKFYLQGNPYHFLRLKEKLAKITDYWDFSGFNTITTDNYYYYETSHYRSLVGDIIICRMTNCSNVEVPEDFGVFITGDNIKKHIVKQKDRLIKYNAEKLTSD